MGYPPIPFTREPTLVAVSCDVNAVVDLRTGKTGQLHFILSATPRGGFSGGLAFGDDGLALGVVTQSLMLNHAVAELGFFAATSIESIFVCLQHHGILPECQKIGWQGRWDGGDALFDEDAAQSCG
jgi:hypothetical protein